MIKLVVLFLLFFTAVASVPFLIGEKGYILIAFGDFTIESSVVTAVIMLTLLFLILMIGLKLLRGGFKFSLGAWNKIAFANRRRGQRDLNKGIASFLLNDFKQAEHLLAKSAEPSEQAQIAYLMAAYAAQQQNLSANADHYLQLVAHQQQRLKDVGLESILVQINLLMARKELAKARAIIDEHHRHIGHDARLLALEIDLCIAEERFETAIDYLNQARKNKAIEHDKIEQWEAIAFHQHFERLISQKSNQILLDYWQNMPRKLKQREAILLAYCQVLAKANIVEPLEKLLLPVVKKGTNSKLIEALKTLPIQQSEAFVIAIEKHLKQNPQDIQWLSCLGHFAYAGSNFILAEKAMKTLSQKLTTPMDKDDLLIYAHALIEQEKYEQAALLLIKQQ